MATKDCRSNSRPLTPAPSNDGIQSGREWDSGGNLWRLDSTRENRDTVVGFFLFSDDDDDDEEEPGANRLAT